MIDEFIKNKELVSKLWVSASASHWHKHHFDFEVIHMTEEFKKVLKFEDNNAQWAVTNAPNCGSMYWLRDEILPAYILQQYFISNGHEAVILWDMGTDDICYCVWTDQEELL